MVRDEAILLDIVRAARLVLKFREGIDKASFFDDLKTQSAILHQLMLMGEAVKRLSAEFRVQHSKVPWTLIAGMRDKLIHGYDVVDLDQVWQTAVKDVPELLLLIEPLISGQE
ncbi:MAG: HepT-like ribonuclease domain-containing protein [Desulfobacterales bacterium]